VDPGVAPPYADEAPPAASAAPYALASAARIFSLCSKPYGRLVSRPSALALARSDSICFIQYASTSSLVLCASLPSAYAPAMRPFEENVPAAAAPCGVSGT
jgi:hypothetical protein